MTIEVSEPSIVTGCSPVGLCLLHRKFIRLRCVAVCPLDTEALSVPGRLSASFSELSR